MHKAFAPSAPRVTSSWPHFRSLCINYNKCYTQMGKNFLFVYNCFLLEKWCTPTGWRGYQPGTLLCLLSTTWMDRRSPSNGFYESIALAPKGCNCIYILLFKLPLSLILHWELVVLFLLLPFYIHLKNQDIVSTDAVAYRSMGLHLTRWS